MTTEKRLDSIEKRLTPRQVVAAYVEDVRGRYPSLNAWLEAVSFRQEQEPIGRMIPSAEAGIRDAMKGEPRDAVGRAVKDARLEVYFLHDLAIEVQGEFLHDSDACNLRAALCARGLQILLTDAPGERPQRIRAVREEAERLVAKVYLHRQAVDVVEGNYFGGRPVLFDDEARLLEIAVNTAETVIEEYNRLAREGRGGLPEGEGPAAGGLLIDPEAVQDLARSNVRREVAFMVNMAKAKAMAETGMRREAQDLVKGVWQRRYPDTRCG